MARVTYVNGRYLPHGEAGVHVEDRGFQFSDGVYEVVAVRDGRLANLPHHLSRLQRSLAELAIPRPMGDAALVHVMGEVVRRNRVRNGIVYLQVTRGSARRDHAFPKAPQPTLVVSARSQKGPSDTLFQSGVTVITLPDIRWKRRDIKTVSLLANVLSKQAAKEAGAYEAWLVDEQGLVTEGTASNAWIVTRDGELVTRSLSHDILPGITRARLLECARSLGLRFAERAFTPAEAKAAAEAFVTGTTSTVMPVVRIDDATIGAGVPGPVAQALRDAFLKDARS